jgi:fucose permease
MTGPAGDHPDAEPEWRTLSRLFWINQIAGICVGAIEFSLTLWCAKMLRDQGGVSPGLAATGVSAIVAGMAAGRAVGGWLALRFSMDKLLIAAFGTNMLGFAVFWITSMPAVMFVGLAIAGLGMSLEFPLVSARAIELAGGRAELAGAVNMFSSGIAIGGAPFLLGFLSDQIGIRSAYLLVPVLIAVAIAALLGSRSPVVQRPAALPVSESMAA